MSSVPATRGLLPQGDMRLERWGRTGGRNLRGSQKGLILGRSRKMRKSTIRQVFNFHLPDFVKIGFSQTNILLGKDD